MEDAFDDLEARAWSGLMRVHGRMLQRMEADLLATAGLTNAEFEVLLQLTWSGTGQLRHQELAARSLLTRSGMTRLIDRLEKNGLVERRAVEGDARGAAICLTPAGRARFRKAKRSHVAFVRANFLSRFTREDLATLAALWQKAETPDD